MRFRFYKLVIHHEPTKIKYRFRFYSPKIKVPEIKNIKNLKLKNKNGCVKVHKPVCKSTQHRV